MGRNNLSRHLQYGEDSLQDIKKFAELHSGCGIMMNYEPR